MEIKETPIAAIINRWNMEAREAAEGEMKSLRIRLMIAEDKIKELEKMHEKA